MAYRYTNTDKWNDSWFCSLSKFQKLLFLYICDNCDIAGFIEINEKRWKSDLEFTDKEFTRALEGLTRGLIYSKSNDCIYVRNFLKHQKNLPLNEKNNAHSGIIKRFDIYKNKFDIDNIEEFINQEFKPLTRGYGNGKGKEDDKKEDIKNWRNDFETYKIELNVAVNTLLSDSSWIKEREKFLPNLDIKLSLEKAYKDFWGTEAGWHHKKKSKSQDLNWKKTLNSAIELNKVYKQR